MGYTANDLSGADRRELEEMRDHFDVETRGMLSDARNGAAEAVKELDEGQMAAFMADLRERFPRVATLRDKALLASTEYRHTMQEHMGRAKSEAAAAAMAEVSASRAGEWQAIEDAFVARKLGAADALARIEGKLDALLSILSGGDAA